MEQNMEQFIIITWHRGAWVEDAIGENEPRSRESCEADIAAFQAGKCGPDYAKAYAPKHEGKLWRIVEDDSSWSRLSGGQ